MLTVAPEAIQAREDSRRACRRIRCRRGRMPEECAQRGDPARVYIVKRLRPGARFGRLAVVWLVYGPGFSAAVSLRICPSALSHQLRRLERGIGARLYQAATTRRPWQPTRLEQVNDAFGPISQRSACGKVALDTTAWGAW